MLASCPVALAKGNGAAHSLAMGQDPVPPVNLRSRERELACGKVLACPWSVLASTHAISSCVVSLVPLAGQSGPTT